MQHFKLIKLNETFDYDNNTLNVNTLNGSVVVVTLLPSHFTLVHYITIKLKFQQCTFKIALRNANYRKIVKFSDPTIKSGLYKVAS